MVLKVLSVIKKRGQHVLLFAFVAATSIHNLKLFWTVFRSDMNDEIFQTTGDDSSQPTSAERVKRSSSLVPVCRLR
ncbi:hypothetical protein Y032_0091g2454 [Ancylostoma ceylanicum]|uniref:Uncharacterized protein n=1 Tax=Ancylostoma ceylanicum TaxID=53326 RepID=A0A016TMB0_9BILA|nr:hypothetical protein Y032_0091g2454 [Ancylostoma ceylanicum]